MPASPKVVLVREHQQPDPVLGCEPTFTLNFHFREEHPQDGFAAWVTAETRASQDIDVAAFCERFDGGFRQQALNRFTAQAIIRERPQALVVQGLWGCTADLPRIAALLGVPTIVCLAPGQVWPEADHPATQQWLASCRDQCAHVLVHDSIGANTDGYDPMNTLPGLLSALPDPWTSPQTFSYASYEFALRDPPLLSAMQASTIRHFEGLDAVLDVACGAGIFMDALRASGHRVTGVERDPEVAAYARGMGLEVIEEDALAYLRETSGSYDGIHCSHFVEHVPVEVVQELLTLLHRRTRPGGAVVLTFPDPESIRSQLLGFWRDPEHVRFYHPELIAAMATVAGFAIEWTSYQEQPHEIVPFASTPPPLPAVSAPAAPVLSPEAAPGPLARLLGACGLQSLGRARAESSRWQDWARRVETSMQAQQAALEILAERTESLWAVNQTWAWQDNATIKLRRRAD